MPSMAFRGCGSPEVLRPAALPILQLEDGELLIEMQGIAVNPAVYECRLGVLASLAPVPFPHVPRFDVAGKIVRGGHPGRRYAAKFGFLRGGAGLVWLVQAALGALGCLPLATHLHLKRLLERKSRWRLTALAEKSS